MTGWLYMVSNHVIKSCDPVTSHTLVVDFFNRINLIYGTVSDHCTDTTCPIMSGGPKYVTIVMIMIDYVTMVIGMNIYGLIQTNIKSQQHYQLHSI